MQAFVWLSGQDDNLGDIVLRRRMVAAIPADVDAHVFVGRATPGFLEGLELHDRWSVYPGQWTWLLAAARAALRPRSSCLVFNPGEIRSNATNGVPHLALSLIGAVGRLLGNRVVRMGIGARDKRLPWSLPISAAATVANVNVWRDQWSKDLYGVGEVGPDWAFGDEERHPHTPTGEGERDLLALCYRWDFEPLSDTALAAVRALAQRLDLTPVVVTQARRDQAADRALAARLGAEVVEWDETTSHPKQEALVRSTYRRSRLVLSDRIHALIIGSAEGAVPVGLMEHADIKVQRTLAAAGLNAISADVRGWDVEAIDAFLDSCAAPASARRVGRAMDGARAAVARQDDVLRAHVTRR